MSALLISTALIASSGATLKYQLESVPSQQDKVNVSVDTKALETFRVLPARELASDKQPNVYCVAANNTQFALEFHTPVKCEQVTWQLTLAEVGKEGFDIAQQIDSYQPNKGWGFISEFNSLPRFSTLNDELYPAQVCSPDQQCGLLPHSSQPPLFVIWGLKPIELNINDKKIKVTTDTEQILQTIDIWKPALESQLNYLINLFPDATVTEWDIAFFTRDKNAGSVSGAAGSDKILINALLDNGEFKNDDMPMLLKIAAHESMHLLDTKTPLWASESIAEYYANKSLHKTAYEYTEPLTQWYEFEKTFPASDTGLIEASARVSNQSQYQYYPLFYVKGPAFWQSIDQLLVENGASLDTLLPTLSYDSDANLSKSSIAQISAIIGKANWDKLAAMYL